ncbi:MAG: ABC transporter permease [Bacilli bacterium]|nr:ABC transporter permease [Bacilli bacterium]MDD4076580.1 ABC transporter permease [Bacilli bacterium]MDD4388157.1 ABC transporter permease [Bacilli bacterium]
MVRYTIKRLFLIFITLFIILSLSFFLIKLLPDNNELQYLMNKVKPEDYALMRKQWGYDKPLFVQYLYWLKNVIFHWDWGVSTHYLLGRDTFEILTQFLPITMRLNLVSLVISIPLGLLFGIVAALRKNKPIDYIISVFVILFISIPSFVVVTMMMLSANDLGLPIQYRPSDMANYKDMIIPVLSLSFGPIAVLTRYTRAELIEVLTSDFILLARTKGLNRFHSTVRHGMRNSMVPLVPIIIGNFIGILFGSLVIERVYGVPGVAGILIESIGIQDYNLTMTALAFYTIISLVATLIVDLTYGIVDPRIRMGSRK